MARLGALVCCLLAAWHCRPGLGLPLAPAGTGPAVGESLYPFRPWSCPRAAATAHARSEHSEWAEGRLRQGPGIRDCGPVAGRGEGEVTEAPECPLGSAGRSGLADNSGGTAGALLFSCSCFHFVSPYVFCSRAKGRKHWVSRGKKEAGGWMSRIPRGPESALVGRGSCRVSIAQQCTFQCDSEFIPSCSPSLVTFSSYFTNHSTAAGTALPTR